MLMGGLDAVVQDNMLSICLLRRFHLVWLFEVCHGNYTLLNMRVH